MSIIALKSTVCTFVSKLQVSDFGLSKPLDADSTGFVHQGTLRALAPEAIPTGSRVERGQPADVYA